MKILVVGGAGYIGTALCHRLVPEHDVTVVDPLIFGDHALHSFMVHDNFHFIKADVNQAHVEGFDAVVNLAAYTLPLCNRFPEQGFFVNRDSAINLAHHCRRVGVRYIFPSTCSNYGVKTDGYAVETDELFPTSNYAASKVDVERMLSSLDMDYVILRFATAYGLAARFRPDLLLHDLIRSALKTGRIDLYGASFYRPLCHVDDIARAIIMALEAAPAKSTYNIGNTQHNFTKRELAAMLQQHLDCLVVESASISDPRNYRVSFEKVRTELGFQTIHKPEQEIEKIVTHYKQSLQMEDLVPFASH